MSGPATSPPTADAVPRGASGAAIIALPAPTDAAPPAPPPPTITLPVITHDDGAAYPAEALQLGLRDTVTVILVLDLDATGHVRNARVENPVGNPFEAAAIAAAKALVFDPATRNGTPIAARIKHKYEFAPPPARLVGRVFAESTGAPVGLADVRVKSASGAELTTASAADGTWTLPAVPFGKFHVEVQANGFQPQSADDEVGPGEEAQIVLRLGLSPGAAGGPKPTDDDIEDVTVQGQRPPREVTRRTLEQRELSRIPGTNGDALRALQNLPGVARPPALAGLLIVRGSAPNATNYFIDGTLVPLVYHFGGLSSVVPTEIIDRLDFYPGNFSSQFGRVTGGIVDVGIRSPSQDGKYHGLAQMDLIDARVLAEGPLGNSGWKFALAGRRSWIDVWLKPVLTSLGSGVTAAPVYYDYQAILERDIGKGGNVRFLLLGSDDRLEILLRQTSGQGFGGDLGLHTGFWRIQGRYRQHLGPLTDFKATIAAGEDIVEFNAGANQLSIKSYPVTSRVELSQKVAPGVTADVGMDWLWAPYDVFVNLPPPPSPGQPPAGPGFNQPPRALKQSTTQYRPALYTEFEITPAAGTRIVPSVRLDYAKDTKSWDVAPRFIARQDITRSPRTTLKGGVGVFFQPPDPQNTTAAFGVPGIKSSRAIHYDVGVEREVTRNIDLSVEGYYKQLDDFFTARLGNVASGHAVGVETLLRYKPGPRFFGWLAYTLSQSLLRDSPGEPLRPAQFDQTHILTVLGSYRLGRGWEIGSRFRIVSGNLVTPNTYGFYDENAGANLPLQAYPPNSQRLPLFNQLDVRVDKVWAFRSWKLSAYLDIQNVYNMGNVEGLGYNFNYTQQSYTNGIPILPSLGLRAEL